MSTGDEVTVQFNAGKVCAYVQLRPEIGRDLFKLSRALPGNQMLKQLAMLTVGKSESELEIAKTLQAGLSPNIPFYRAPEKFLEAQTNIIAFKKSIERNDAKKIEIPSNKLVLPCYQDPMHVFSIFNEVYYYWDRI